MAAQSSVITSAASTLGNVSGALLTALVERSAYVLKRTETLADLTQPGGQVYLVIHSETTGYAYYYDPSDTTTPDDGETVLVDFDGRRYHVADGAYINTSSVLAIQDSPPGSPVSGDAYIVGDAPTGAWVGHSTDIAIYTARGWIFAAPQPGQTVLNEATETNYQFSTAGDWDGFVVEMADGGIRPASLAFPFGVAVEGTLNAPPGSPVAGQYIIVGTSPTGAFSGHANAVATYRGATWEFIAPYTGAYVYEKTQQAGVIYQSGAWSVDTLPYLGRPKYNLALSNNALDATNDIDIAAGFCSDETGTVIMRRSTSLTKTLDGTTWVVGSGNAGRDAGSISNAWWYVWLIMRPDTGVVDALFSLSATSPTMPSGYTYKRRIGAVLRLSNVLQAFFQRGDDFWWAVQKVDRDSAVVTTSAELLTISVPVVNVLARVTASISTNGNSRELLITSPTQTDSTPGGALFSLRLRADSGIDGSDSGQFHIPTITGQIRTRSTAASDIDLKVFTTGWRDDCGRNG